MNKLSPFKWFCLQNFPFIEADFDALTNYELMCKVYEYVSKIVVKTNELGEEVEALAHYIENLDIQEEVNNKLDEMAESGELAEIMAGYLNQRAIFSFDSVSDMKQAENLVAGSFTETYGYYENGDLGSAKYYIREVTNQDVVNEMDIIAIGTGNLVAEFIPTNDELNIKQFGAKCDGSSDDSDIIQFAIDYINSKYTPYVQAGSQLELVGNYKACKITKTLKVPHNLRMRGLYLDVYSGTYTGNYVIKVNIDDEDDTDWKVAYPRENIGYMKECRIYNKTANSYNCILNGSNNTFSDISVDGFDISYKAINKYLDSHKLIGWHVTNCIDSTNYAIQLGFLGDIVKMENCAIDSYDSTNSYNRAVDTGSSHNGIELLNNIIHGNISAHDSTIKISNLHMEGGQILCTSANIEIDNAFLWKDGINIQVSTRTNLKLSNVRIVYRYKNTSYQGVSDVDISSDTSSNIIVEMCYKYIVGNNITANNMDFLKVSNVTAPLNNITSKIQGVRTHINDTYPFPGSFNAGAKDSSAEFVDWYLPTGTYYYRAVKIVDFDRNLGYPSYSQKFNVELTNGEGGMRSTSAYKGSKWRVYRGTAEDTYSEYADISHQVGEVFDNGYMINGSSWNSRTPGDIDTFNAITNNTLTKYDENDNIVCHMASTPTSGTWKVDDIVITSSKVYRCTNGANGGTWVEV